MNRRRLRLLAPWLAMAVILAVAFTLGARRPAPAPTAAQRAAAIESQLRCPSCEDVSVADSSAPVAVAIKAIVEQRVAAGQGSAAIEAFLVSRYGEDILLRPPTNGGISAVWIVPLIFLVAGLAGLGAFFWRRRRCPAPAAVSDEERSAVERALAERAVADAPAGR